MPKVTIIIPAYNAEATIQACAESVLRQTLKDIEILFIDDGSTDRTGELLDQLTEGYDNARVIHQENKGLYKTRETGLALATGEYIGWVDADDYVEPDMYETLWRTATEQDSELVICDYTWFPEKIPTKEKWFREYQGTVDTGFVERNSQPWNKIVRRELMERLDIGPLFPSCFDEIYILILMKARNPVTIAQPLYHYRVSGETMSSSYTNVEHYRSFVGASEKLREVMRRYTEDPYWTEYFDYRVIYYRLMTMIVAANTGDRKAYEQNRKELEAMKPAYYRNRHYRRILRENFGIVKAAVIGSVIPRGYVIARPACKAGIR